MGPEDLSSHPKLKLATYSVNEEHTIGLESTRAKEPGPLDSTDFDASHTSSQERSAKHGREFLENGSR